MQRFQESYGQLASDPYMLREFLTRFYEIFVASSPDVADRFLETDMVRQRQMLGRSLVEIVEFSTTLQETDQLRAMAKRHGPKVLNITPQFYDLWMNSLIEAAQEFIPGFDDDTELAWRVVTAPGIAYMKHSYDRL